MSFRDYAHLPRGQQQTSATGGARKASDGRGGGERGRRYTSSFSSFSVPRPAPPPESTTATTSNSTTALASTVTSASTAIPPAATPSTTPRLYHPAPLHVTILHSREKGTPNLISPALPYRPFYLHHRVLVTFLMIFGVLIATTEILLYFSVKHNGIITISELSHSTAAHYLWRLLMPAVSLLVVGGWARVEYQTKMVAPWAALAKGKKDGSGEGGHVEVGKEAEKTVLLDYLSCCTPVVLFKSVNNSDWVVFLVTVVGVLLKGVVVLSVGLVSLGVVVVMNQATDIRVLSMFGDELKGLENARELGFYNLASPGVEVDGVSGAWAYQRFEAVALPAGMWRTVSAEVDGFKGGLECEAAEIALGQGGVRYVGEEGVSFETTFAGKGGCNVSMPIYSRNILEVTGQQDKEGNIEFGIARLGMGRCKDSTGEDGRQVVVVSGMGTIDPSSVPSTQSAEDSPVNGRISRSTQLLCKPTYMMNRVMVTKRGSEVIGVNLTPDQQQSRALKISPWTFAETVLSPLDDPLAKSFADTTPWFCNSTLNVDTAMYLALNRQFRATGEPPSPEALLQPETLKKVATDYYQRYVALLGARALVEDTTSSEQGATSMLTERLIVSPLAAHLAAVFLSLSAVLTLTVIFVVPKQGFLPRDPGTILDMAALTANSRSFLQSLRGAGGADMAKIRKRLADSKFFTGIEAHDNATDKDDGSFKIFARRQQEATSEYVDETHKFPYPSFLHPIQRVLALLLIVAMIIGLDFSLQTSIDRVGLGSACLDTNSHLVWTTVPALVMGVVAVFFASMSFMTRVLAPYAAMNKGASFEKTASLNLVDRTTPGVLYGAIKLRNLAVGTATSAAFVSCLLVFFSASLFSAATVPITASVQLVNRDTFAQGIEAENTGPCPSCENGAVIASLILDGNASYPPFTYENMAFPSFSVLGAPQNRDPPDQTFLTGVIPALRPSMACRMLRDADMEVQLTTSATVGGVINPLMVGIAGDANSTILIGMTKPDNSTSELRSDALFGAAAYRPIVSSNNTISRWIWVWGQLRNAGTNRLAVQSVFGLTCNETIQQLNVTTRFAVNSSLTIDTSSPPIPDLSSVTLFPLVISTELDYTNLIPLQTSDLLDPFFVSLTSSRWAVSLSASPEIIVTAIEQQHKIIRTQILSASYRFSGGPSTQAPQPLSLAQPTLSIPATITIPSPRRILQDSLTTRILQSLLALLFILSSTSWLTFRSNILPRNPTSIASITAFLADGNMYNLLGRDPEWRTTEELEKHFKDGVHVTRGFSLDWEAVRKRSRATPTSGRRPSQQGMASPGEIRAFGVRAGRTGGWGGGENVGLGMMARVGLGQRGFVRDWGWRT
ncbi:hypothetical protein QBC35DRAFT_432975 [Podospora australis]|uniref:Uncharacterized protein n=1 Tax=Podospora australis TaxID=1536484 RepID=A0AAN6WUK1_9PEZI|nr:hypothetical protein QBC35DRAFT_432975 [Podospora australis]